MNPLPTPNAPTPPPNNELAIPSAIIVDNPPVKATLPNIVEPPVKAPLPVVTAISPILDIGIFAPNPSESFNFSEIMMDQMKY